jgi:hypothetical protein
LAASPLTALQATRLRNLGISFDAQHTTTADAASLIRAADGAKRPTPALLKKATALGVAVPVGATRASLTALIEEAEIAGAAKELIARGAKLPGILTKQVMADFRMALDGLEFGLAQVKERGLVLPPPTGLDIDQIEHFSQALDDFWSAAGDMPDALREMHALGYSHGSHPRPPSEPRFRSSSI